MNEKKKGERVHGTAGIMQQDREQHYIEKHDQSKQAAWNCLISFFEQMAKSNIAATPKAYDQDQDRQRGYYFKKDVCCQNQQGLTKHGSPAQHENSGKGYVGLSLIPANTVYKNAAFALSAQYTLDVEKKMFVHGDMETDFTLAYDYILCQQEIADRLALLSPHIP